MTNLTPIRQEIDEQGDPLPQNPLYSCSVYYGSHRLGGSGDVPDCRSKEEAAEAAAVKALDAMRAEQAAEEARS